MKNLRSIMKIPSESKRDMGGMHSHFFHDMPKEVKQLVLDEYQKNIKLIHGNKEVLNSGVYKKTVVRSGQLNATDPRLPEGAGAEGGGSEKVHRR
tara:strand:+ start:469 stop:753 length:285 start_codon:yes stop_codon:yes gene_type:complete